AQQTVEPTVDFVIQEVGEEPGSRPPVDDGIQLSTQGVIQLPLSFRLWDLRELLVELSKLISAGGDQLTLPLIGDKRRNSSLQCLALRELHLKRPQMRRHVLR